MRTIYAFPKPSRYNLDDLRTRLAAAGLGAEFGLFESETHLSAETDEAIALDADSLARLAEVFSGYVYVPRAFVFPAPERFNLGALGDAFRAAGVPGFAGMSRDGAGNLRAEFPERTEPFTPDEIAALEGVAASYVYKMTLDECRRLRAEAYPAIGDQLDALWKGGAAAEEMKAQIAAVKATYPKPTT